jgi:hypothetical protein
VSHIPIAFDVLGILATLNVLAVTFEAKTKGLRTRPPGPGPESHSMNLLERLTHWLSAVAPPRADGTLIECVRIQSDAVDSASATQMEPNSKPTTAARRFDA